MYRNTVCLTTAAVCLPSKLAVFFAMPMADLCSFILSLIIMAHEFPRLKKLQAEITL
jgi:hypothetical protein